MKRVILGTAGHIDHGKSTLVKALTGIDPDRLKEEKERGITIELGYSHLSFEPDLIIGIVDVPGHERFVKTMVSGATGIDVVLLVVAADEGIMAQTKEHFEICRLLGIKEGLIAITKVDLVEEELVEIVEEEIRELVKGTFLEGKPIVKVDSVTGRGLSELKEAIREVSLRVPEKPPNRPFRLYADRVFTMKGFGTVVTGTALSGKVSVGDELEVFPVEEKVKVRGIQTYGRKVETAYAGMRVALNISGLSKDEIDRGFCFTERGSFSKTEKVLVRLRVSELTGREVRTGAVYRFLAGSTISLARVVLVDRERLSPGESGIAKLILDRPFVLVHGDSFILRGSGTMQTYGGGTVLDPFPVPLKRSETRRYAEGLESHSLEDKILSVVSASKASGEKIDRLSKRFALSGSEVESIVDSLVKKGKLVRAGNEAYTREFFLSVRNRLIEFLSEFHRKNPFKKGMLKEELRSKLRVSEGLFAGIVKVLSEEGVVKATESSIALAEFSPSLPDDKLPLLEEVKKLYKESHFTPPSLSEVVKRFGDDVKVVIDFLEQEGTLLKITPKIYIYAESFKEFSEIIKGLGKDGFTIQDAKSKTGLSRKYLVPYLEYLDKLGVTFRAGDRRYFRS